MDVYLERFGKCAKFNDHTHRFYFRGNRFRPEQTPDELEIEDGGVIDAVAAAVLVQINRRQLIMVFASASEERRRSTRRRRSGAENEFQFRIH